MRDRRVHYVITYRGQPVGLLLPLDQPSEASHDAVGEESTTTWEELTRLGEEIGRGWRSPLTSAELLSGMRR